MTNILIRGRAVNCIDIPENFVIGDADSSQDGIAAVWTWFWKYRVPDGNVIAFKSIRDYRYSLAMTLKDAPTTALADEAEIRIAVYHPDDITLKKILWIGTYATIKNGSKYKIEEMIHVTRSYDVQPAELIRLEVYHASETLDVSACTIDLGCTRWVPA